VAKYFSSKIILNELSTIKTAITQSEFDDENLEIRVNEFTREITTRYQVDEGQKNEMSIRLPPSYPLAEVEIVSTSHVGVVQERWNKWLLTCKIACKVSRF
jgi:E3 ubiquitin-protein ligase listerin